MPQSSTATKPWARRRRSDTGSHTALAAINAIPHAPHGLDQAALLALVGRIRLLALWPGRPQLGTQTLDAAVDDPRIARIVVPPYLFQQQLAREDAAPVGQQQVQQVEFEPGQAEDDLARARAWRPARSSARPPGPHRRAGAWACGGPACVRRSTALMRASSSRTPNGLAI